MSSSLFVYVRVCVKPQVAQARDMSSSALLRDSSDLHIYKDLYGENNDCFCNL